VVLNPNKLLTAWKQEHSELKGVFSQVLQNVQERVDLAFKAFFRRVNVVDPRIWTVF
jgi:putative transposase